MSTVTSKDGVVIGYERSGDGPALIMVSGAFAHRAMFAQGDAPSSGPATPFSLITYDRRGRGESGDNAPYAVEREVDDLAALIEAAGGSAFVFGHSSGAGLALEAARQGLNIPKLAVYEPPFIIDDSRPPAPSDFVSHLNELIAANRRGDAVAYFMIDAVGTPAEVVAGMRETPMWPALEAVAHTLPYDGAVMGDTMRGNPDSLRRYASIGVPTLVLDGELSDAWIHNSARTLAGLLPHAQYQTVKGQDHSIAPDILMPILEAFFLG